MSPRLKYKERIIGCRGFVTSLLMSVVAYNFFSPLFSLLDHIITVLGSLESRCGQTTSCTHIL